MKIDNGFDLSIFALFTIAIILIGLPTSLYLFKKGIEGFRKYKFGKLPKGYLIVPGFGTYPLEVLFYGLFIFAFSMWYLFIDNGGQLQNFINEAGNFLSF